MRPESLVMAAPEGSLRKRKVGDVDQSPASPPTPARDPAGSPAQLRTGTYWLTRVVLLQALAFIYFVAFLVAFNQNKALIGDRGLLPCRLYLKNVQQYFKGRIGWGAWSYTPTILWLMDWSNMNFNLDLLALLGLGLSFFVLVTGCANMILMATLWVLYMSLVNVGQIWYSFGWESQLLETGFLGIFLCPLWTLSRLPKHTPTSRVVLWGFRWLIFRIMLGAGLIKIRGDKCWLDLTCMDFHYEVILIISGNLSFLNWLTIVPSLACFDDAALGFLFPSGPRGLKNQVLKIQKEDTQGVQSKPRYGCTVRQVVNFSLGILVAWLSVPVVINLLSSRQVMNTSFNPLRIVNTYGAFGSITKERTEVILQGTASPNASAPDAVWEDYEFKCKPGDPWRRPCLISPYHYRLDWLMWFAAFQTYEHNDWIIHLAGKLLAGDAETLSLLALNPFEGRAPPRWIRGEHYRYRFSLPSGQHAAQGKWWIRKRIGPYFPPLHLEDLKDYFKTREWPLPKPPLDTP
ncbi:lipase maturation factor 1 isoform X2 [Phodopus roborovskii]|uniref:lipase maturation factor 1 isoform X2 n=1 Tax=Phodopus roborovskii TaxID=109678 RepID=UPI0021E43624|nr:lipase maturation factor 1 isoform X2 [Phodopus roborovskii]